MKRIIISLACILSLVAGAGAKTVVDIIDVEHFDIFPNGYYQSYEDIYGATAFSPAVWMFNLHNNAYQHAIVIRSTEGNPSGMVTTRSGGILKKITFTFTNLTDVTSYTDRDMMFFGRKFEEGPYNSIYDMFDPDPAKYKEPGPNAGHLIGTYHYKRGTGNYTFTIVPTDEYEYLGIRTKELATFITTISIEWEVPDEACQAPVMSLQAGEYTEAQQVSISCPTPGARIYYTLDSTDPANVKNRPMLYTGPITVDRSTMVRAYAEASKLAISPTTTCEYAIIKEGSPVEPLSVGAPIFSKISGNCTGPFRLSMISATEDATIHYTLDGSKPTINSLSYTEPITISAACTVKAIAAVDDCISEVAQATYTFDYTQSNSLDEANAMPDGSDFIMGSDLVVTYSSGSYNYVYDMSANAEAYGLIYAADLGLTPGNVIKSGWSGCVTDFNGLILLVPTTDLTTDGTASLPDALEVTSQSMLSGANLHRPIEMKSVWFDAPTPETSASFTGLLAASGENIPFYNAMRVGSVAPGEYKVDGFVAVSNGSYLVYPTAFTPLSGIENILTTDVEAEYFNLLGQPVTTPVHGNIYIVRRGNTVTREAY